MKEKPTLNDLKLVINKWGGRNIPTVYLEGESWYEVLQILANKVYESLEWIEGYFNTDLDSIVEQTLNEWIDDGTIQVVISEALQGELDEYKDVVDTQLGQLEQELGSRLDKATTDVTSYTKTPMQSIPPKKGLLTNSNKLVVKAADNHVRVVQKTNKGYVAHDFKDGVGGSGATDTAVNYELFRLLKSTALDNVYVAFEEYTVKSGSVTTLYEATQAKNVIENNMFNIEYITLDTLNNFSNKEGNVGLSMKGLSNPSSESVVSYSIRSGKASKANVLLGGSTGSTPHMDIVVNGEIVKTVNTTKFVQKLIEFDIPCGERGGNITVELVNRDTTGKPLYFSCLNLFTLDNYDGQHIDMYRGFVLPMQFIDAGGSSDYAFYDVETEKWVGSYHGGETAIKKEMMWTNTLDTRFDHVNRFRLNAINHTRITPGSYFITPTFEMHQRTTLTTDLNKTAKVISIFNFDVDGSIEMNFSLYDNEIKMSNLYTALTCTHIDLNVVESPNYRVLGSTNSQENVYNSEGYVRQRDSGNNLVLDNRFTLFQNTYNTKDEPVYIANYPTLYRKLYYGPVVNYDEGVVIPNLTFSKALDFYRR